MTTKKRTKRRHRATDAKKSTRLGVQLITLYRAFLRAEAVAIPFEQMVKEGSVPFWRARFVAPVPEVGVGPGVREGYEEIFGNDVGEREESFINQGAFLMMLSWALLYVVIEGWKELREIFPNEQLWFPPIDELLADEKLVGLLKDHRDVTFHVQEKNWDERSVNIWKEGSRPLVQWTQEVRLAFDHFFAMFFWGKKPLTLYCEHDPSKDEPWTTRLLELSPTFVGHGATPNDARAESIGKAVLAFGKLWSFSVVDQDGKTLYVHESDLDRETQD